MAPKGQTATVPPDEVIFGQSEAMKALRQTLSKVTSANIPVLIEGESGTGKEVIANYIHSRSIFASGAFVKVNCAAIPGTLIESELFGFEKGAFTGANGNKPGRVEKAAGGTLFMDEIGELDLGIQAKLLHFMQDGHFVRIGSQEEKKIDVRFICATNRDLEKEVAKGSFRGDLYYRINVINLQLPPLRQRVSDLPVLANYFLKFYSESFGIPAQAFSPLLLEMIVMHDWPGNIRELENLVKRYVIVGSEEEIISGHPWRRKGRQISSGGVETIKSLKEVSRQAIQSMERKAIFNALHSNHWNRKLTARQLNISYRALLYKIKSAGLPARRASKSNGKANATASHMGQLSSDVSRPEGE
jgi:two-component system, NtrC family, response regulator AtoC